MRTHQQVLTPPVCQPLNNLCCRKYHAGYIELCVAFNDIRLSEYLFILCLFYTTSLQETARLMSCCMLGELTRLSWDEVKNVNQCCW